MYMYILYKYFFKLCAIYHLKYMYMYAIIIIEKRQGTKQTKVDENAEATA